MKVHYIDEDELNEFDRLSRHQDPETGTRLIRESFQKLHSRGVTHIARQLNSLRPDFEAKKTVINRLGLPLHQAKKVFVWKEPRPPIKVPNRLIFRSFEQVGKEVLLDVIIRCHHKTLDRAVKSLIAEQQNRQKDLTGYINEELAEIEKDFVFKPDWWQLAYTSDDRLAGYVQPVLFPGMKKGDLEEGTIYYIGVVPEFRGNGYVNDILAKGVAVLQGVGIWQIYCDTDCENHPMANACQAAGFEEEGINYIWEGKLDELFG